MNLNTCAACDALIKHHEPDDDALVEALGQSDEEKLRLRIALSRARALLVEAGNALAAKDDHARAERLHAHADGLRAVLGDVEAPVPTAEAELRELLAMSRRYLERGGRYTRTGSGLLDDLDAVLGPRTPGDGDNDLPF